MSVDPYKVHEIDGRLYVGGASPEAQKAREREEAKRRHKAQQEALALAERERRESAEAQHGPMLEAWPAVRQELARRQEEAEARLLSELAVSPVFGAFVEVLAVQRARHLGSSSVGAARSEITGQTFLSPSPPSLLDLLGVVRKMGEESGRSVLGEARAVAEEATEPVEDAVSGEGAG